MKISGITRGLLAQIVLRKWIIVSSVPFDEIIQAAGMPTPDNLIRGMFKDEQMKNMPCPHQSWTRRVNRLMFS